MAEAENSASAPATTLVYAHDLGAFLTSPNAAPISSDPTRADWASPDARARMLESFTMALGPGKTTLDHVLLLIYNKSRWG